MKWLKTFSKDDLVGFAIYTWIAGVVFGMILIRLLDRLQL